MDLNGDVAAARLRRRCDHDQVGDAGCTRTFSFVVVGISGGWVAALVAERCGFNDISHFNRCFRILWRGPAVFDAGVHGAERQDQIQRRDPYDLVTSDNHVGCRWEGAALACPNMRFVPALCEDEVSLEARQPQIFGGLVAEIEPLRGR